MQALKALVGIMGLLIIVGTAVLVWGLYQKAHDPDFHLFGSLTGAPEAPKPAAPAATASTAASFGSVDLGLGRECRIAGMELASNRLFVRVEGGAGLRPDLRRRSRRRQDSRQHRGASVIHLGALLRRQVSAAAEAAYPNECCGLLIGRGDAGDDCAVDRVIASPNVVEGDPRQGFEIDPKLRLETMRALRGGPERILGHYHSHPDHPALPSARDRDMAYEPELIWLIVGVAGGNTTEMRAHRFDPASGVFTEIPLSAE
jgi:proteasome lid subunit RPN8/RPN11